MILNNGDYVIVERAETGNENSEMVKIRENGTVGIVLVGTRHATDRTTLQFTLTAGLRNYSYHVKNLKLLTKEEGFKLQKKQIKAITGDKKQEIKKILEDNILERVPYYLRKDYELGSKKFSLNSNFVALVGNSKTCFVQNNRPSITTCCSITKTSQNMQIYIPKDWLNYYGYNITDLKKWIDFINGCELGSKLEYKEKINLSEVYPLQYQMPSMLLHSDSPAYIVNITSSSSTMITYLAFIALRYIYNYQYWNIPFITLKLKKLLPEASNWQCLLLAHCNHGYYGYYCFTDPNNGMVDVNQELSTVLSRLKNSSSMNSSFKYVSNNQNVRNAIRNNDREFLLTHLKLKNNVK